MFIRLRCISFITILSSILSLAVRAEPFRPPAVPLVTFDPYLSIWSEAGHLADRNTVHWTGHEQSLASLIRIDGRAYRLMRADPENMPALPQLSVKVTPTRSIYEFQGADIHVTLTFMTAALPDDLDVFSWPLTCLTWNGLPTKPSPIPPARLNS